MYCDALFAENMSANVLVPEEALGVNALEDTGELCELGIELQEVRGAECMRFRPVRLPAMPSNDALVNLEQPAVWHVESIRSISSHSCSKYEKHVFGITGWNEKERERERERNEVRISIRKKEKSLSAN